MNTLWQMFALVRKEFLALLRDPRSRLVLVAPPFIQLLVFGYAATFDLNDVPVAVYNQDRGSLSRELLARIDGSPAFRIVHRVDRERQLQALIDNREVMLVLAMQQDFTRNIEQGRSASLQALLDGRNSNSALIALGYLRNILIDFNRTQQQRQGGPPLPAVMEVRAWYNENMASRILIGLVEAGFIISVAVLWFDIPLRGSIGALYLGILLFLLSAVGVGLMISAISVTQQQALLGAFLFLVPAVILSGFATPIANMPQVVQWLSYLDPLRYFLVIVRGVFLEGDSYSLLLHQYWPMALIGGVSLGLAGWLARHRMY